MVLYHPVSVLLLTFLHHQVGGECCSVGETDAFVSTFLVEKRL